MKPVVIAVIAQALWGLGRSALRTKLLAGLGLSAVALSAAGINELLILALCGLAASSFRIIGSCSTRSNLRLLLVPIQPFLNGLGNWLGLGTFPMTAAGLTLPALFFTSLLHPDYHTPRDESARIDTKKIARIAEWMYRTGWKLANNPERPALETNFKLER